MVGMFGLKDPLRDGIKNAVTICRASGINVRMITGDALPTAKAISYEAGILTDADLEEIANDEADFDAEMAAEHEPASFIAMEGISFRTQIGGKVV